MPYPGNPDEPEGLSSEMSSRALAWLSPARVLFAVANYGISQLDGSWILWVV